MSTAAERPAEQAFARPEAVVDRVLAQGRPLALFVDFDGTLVDIVVRFDEVVVPPELPPLLTRLSDRLGGAAAVITGRALADIDRYLKPVALPGCGQHGLELRYTGGRTVTMGGARSLDGLRAAVARLEHRIPGVRVEDKGLTIALHYRERPDAEAEMNAIAEGFARAEDVVLRRGKAVVEIGLGGATKGKALAALMATAPFEGRLPVVFGDDLTDEHAFAAAKAFGGVSIAVGGRVAASADMALDTPRSVRATLEHIAGEEARSLQAVASRENAH